jgi:hypothetical protein
VQDVVPARRRLLPRASPRSGPPWSAPGAAGPGSCARGAASRRRAARPGPGGRWSNRARTACRCRTRSGGCSRWNPPGCCAGRGRPSRAACRRDGRNLSQRQIQLVGGVDRASSTRGAWLVGPTNIPEKTYDSDGWDPVAQQARQHVGPAQERAVDGRAAAQGDVVAAAGAGEAAVDQELLGAKARRRGLLRRGVGACRAAHPTGGRVDVDLDHAGIRSDREADVRRGSRGGG